MLHADELVNQVGVDALSLNISANELATLESLLTSQSPNLTALKEAGLSVNAINMDGASYASVAIEQGLAETLLNVDLSFASEDYVDVHATGTFIQSAIKDLQKLGVDAVTLSGTAVADITDGSIPDWKSIADMGISVGLNVTSGAQLNELSQFAQDAQTVGMDSDLLTQTGIQSIELSGDEAALDSMLSTLDASLQQTISDVQILRSEGFSIDTIDIAGALNTASLTINDEQASVLVSEGLHFASEDHISIDVASGTHLQTSLRDLQKLGVDVINVAGSSLAINLGVDSVGNVTGLPNLSSANLDLTVHGQADQFTSLVFQAIDEDVSLRDKLSMDTANVSFTTEYYGGLSDALQTLNSSYDGVNSVRSLLQQNSIDVVLDAYGTTNASVDVWASAQDLVSSGLRFAEGDHINLVGYANASGTHISSSLKDLQKLGVDTVNSMPSMSMNIDLGADGSLQATGIPTFEKTLDISLNLAKSQQLSEIESMAQALAEAGIDHISLTQEQLADESATQALIGEGIDFNVLLQSTPEASTAANFVESLVIFTAPSKAVQMF